MASTVPEHQLSEARSTWPSVDLPTALFTAFLAKHDVVTGETSAGEDGLDLTELFLVCACLEQVPTAGEVFQQRYFSRARPALTRMKLSAAMISDVEQLAWEKLFTAADSGRPKILNYAGQGNLTTLIKVTLVRTAVSQLRKHKREVLCEAEELLGLPDVFDDPALELVRADFKKEFAPAFAESLATLSERDRNFLRLRFVDNLPVDQIGHLYQMHRVTASRTLSRIRRDLRNETRSRLKSKLQLGQESLDSFMRLVDSQLDVSIEWQCRPTARDIP